MIKNFIVATVPPQLPATQSPIHQIQPLQSVNTSTCSLATNSQNQIESVNSLSCSPATQSQIQIQPSVSVTSPTCSSAMQSESQTHQSSSPLQRPSTSTKRSRVLDANEQLSKKLKCISDTIDEEIEKQRKGLFVTKYVYV